ncbi:MAG: hypothetical protein D3920_01360 [Candidatus Electrothrix sp. AW2]|nr:hypothetical protein [Candidatus Electrothrix sp. AX1]MCI5129229.1 hypothetical protein [Candidatus Electrothrix gigas]MCI5133724.1 hypothetical protein [Candidatus Electrothrix gigas]MCI5180016.1 hypothetical protein [Candidatus Electrothrix gigas]MCI5181318.1 hypothetical protein [Candidatus Electrothrix gigas]
MSGLFFAKIFPPVFPAKLFFSPLVTAFFLDCRRVLRLSSSCSFLRQKDFYKIHYVPPDGLRIRYLCASVSEKGVRPVASAFYNGAFG